MPNALVRQPAAAAGALPEIVSIQYLRGLAAMSIVAFHALGAARNFPAGAAGVDVFFVISGFIMWTLTERAESSPGRFLWRRIVRVAPPYWIATFLTAAIFLVRPHFLWMPPFTLGQLAQSLLFLPHADGWGRAFPVLTQGWTLTYEMFFYVLFAGVLFLPRSRQLAALSAVLVLLAALGLALRPHGPVAGTYLNPVLLEFLAGVWLGRAWRAGQLRSRPDGVLLLAAGVAIFGVENLVRVHDTGWRALVWGPASALVVAGALNLEGAGGLFRSRTLKALGDASYSIYLFHPPIVALGERVFATAPTAVRVSVTLLACALAGVVLHKLVERPLTRALRHAGRRPILAPAPAIAAQGQG